MTNTQERRLVMGAYPQSIRWQRKVPKMTDAQVHAILMNLIGKGKVKV